MLVSVTLSLHTNLQHTRQIQMTSVKQDAYLSSPCVVCRYWKDISEQFTLGKVLGKGQFGTTRIASKKSTGEKSACKTISKRKIVKKQV